MSKFKEVAIIGVSGKFPSINNLDELHQLFIEKIDCVKPFTEKRRDLLRLDKAKKYFEVAYIDDVEYFDYDFFKMSKHEAGSMDPQQKMILELACEAIENAGYSLNTARGSKTSVILGAHNSHFYDDHLEDESGVAMIGNFLDTMAGRISYCLDLHGQSAIVETACSSSLYAIYEACLRLNAEEAEMALAGGITLEFRAKYDNYAETDVLGLISPEARCKTFDESANGINLGEGAGFVLLKRYEDAIRDKDPIHAIIRSIAANQDGGRSNSLAAPSSAAQTEVILNAWEKSDINPLDIGYIEAHGTGTKIGDPIEIQGITEAFKKYTDDKQFCPIGSLKTNFSHLGSAAGIASVIKGIVSLRNKTKYPLRNLVKINSLIDFENSPVYPIMEAESWEDKVPRMMGISAFGVSGTNVHLILEESRTDFSKNDNASEFLVTLSGKYAGAIAEYKEKLKGYIYKYSLGDIFYTLNAGRDDYEFRASCKVKNTDDFLNFLNRKTDISEVKDSRLIYLISGDDNPEAHEISQLKEKYPVFAVAYDELLAKSSLRNTDFLKFIFYVATFRQLEAWGGSPEKILGTGLGNVVIDFITDNLALPDIEQLVATAEYGEFNQAGFHEYIKTLQESDSKELSVIELGKSGIMSSSLMSHPDFISLRVLTAYDTDNSLLSVVSVLYDIGVNINWAAFYDKKENVKVHITTYPFQRTLAWSKNIGDKTSYKNVAVKATDTEIDLKRFLKNLWCEALDVADMNDHDDFFDLGANSLMTINIISSIKKQTGVELDFDDFYTYATLHELEELVKGKQNESISVAASQDISNEEVIRVERKELMKASYNQRRMLFFLETVNNASLYNMPLIFRVEGRIDRNAFLNSLKDVVDRHEILHTVYEKTGGTYYQKILKDYSFKSDFVDMCTDTYEHVLEIISTMGDEAFDLYNEIPITSKLIKIETDIHLWYINMHHIVADGSSMPIFGRDLSMFYKQYISGKTNYSIPDLKVQYVDFAEWEYKFLNSEKAGKQLSFWRDELKSVRGILNFPIDKERPAVQTFNGNKVEFKIDENLLLNCKKYCKAHNITLFMLLETVYALELCRYTNDNDICVGVPVSNRTDDSLKQVVGFFANTVTVRNKFTPDESARTALERSKETITKVYSNIELPFEEVISNIEFARNAAYSPLFQYMFVLQNFIVKEVELGHVKLNMVDAESTSSKFEMTMILYEKGNELYGILEYNKDLFYPATINKFIDVYKYIITYVIEHDETPVNSIPLGEEIASNSSSIQNYIEDYSF